MRPFLNSSRFGPLLGRRRDDDETESSVYKVQSLGSDHLVPPPMSFRPRPHAHDLVGNKRGTHGIRSYDMVRG
jgi:hypothetical protein